jgi:DNA-damage-inducible protein J
MARALKNTKSAMIRARISPSLKEEAEAILKELGLTITEAIVLFYNQIRLYKGLPFDVRIPNPSTQKAMDDLDRRLEATACNNVSELRKKLGV